MAYTATDVKTLRERTGAGMMDCKKALDESDGNIEAAVDSLRAKGLAAAAKKSSRTAAEGLVGVAVGLIGGRFKIVGVQAVVRYDSVLLALFVAVAVSLFFGFSPAYRAASMRPIDALRHE